METFLMFLGFPMNWGLGAGFGGMNQGFGNSGGRGKRIVNSVKDRQTPLGPALSVHLREMSVYRESNKRSKERQGPN